MCTAWLQKAVANPSTPGRSSNMIIIYSLFVFVCTRAATKTFSGVLYDCRCMSSYGGGSKLAITTNNQCG